MTKEPKEALGRELDAALESGDAKQIDRALINSQKAAPTSSAAGDLAGADCHIEDAGGTPAPVETT